MTARDEYTPFMNWDPCSTITVESFAQTFPSLVSMVRDDYHFDEGLLQKSSALLLSIDKIESPYVFVNGLIKLIGQSSPDPVAVFVDSVIELLSSPHPPIFEGSLVFLHRCLDWCSSQNLLAIVSSQLVPRLLSTPRLRDLSVIADKSILFETIMILHNTVLLSSTDVLRMLTTSGNVSPQRVRDVALQEALISIEPALVMISRNRLILSWIEGCKETLRFLTKIFELSAYHQPTLDFVTASRLSVIFQSLFAKVEDDKTHILCLNSIYSNFIKWKAIGTAIMHRGKIMLQTLKREGFEDDLEQGLFRNPSTALGSDAQFRSFRMMNRMGTNGFCPRIIPT
ncbi:hypothetical protein BLNAU_12442 [Blattamonas nauphoetae]|uniref:Uncharacterized protein n=1 Tax=Blattamonas nauphoetae TaxID=2049346 RepID=A0ABQ9XP93_9EUKA|nr:hypothetical protein BLNAU_12442 [Blattamonas nauphoetae]